MCCEVSVAFVRLFHQAEPGCAVAGATLLPKSLRRSPARPQPLEQHPPQLSSTAPTLSAVNVYQGQEVTESRVPSKLDSSADQLVLRILRRIKLNTLGYMGNHCIITISLKKN